MESMYLLRSEDWKGLRDQRAIPVFAVFLISSFLLSMSIPSVEEYYDYLYKGRGRKPLLGSCSAR